MRVKNSFPLKERTKEAAALHPACFTAPSSQRQLPPPPCNSHAISQPSEPIYHTERCFGFVHNQPLTHEMSFKQSLFKFCSAHGRLEGNWETCMVYLLMLKICLFLFQKETSELKKKNMQNKTCATTHASSVSLHSIVTRSVMFAPVFKQRPPTDILFKGCLHRTLPPY